MVFSQHCSSFRTTLFFSRTYIFQCYFRVSNLIQIFQTDLFESSTQSSLVIHNSCSIDYNLLCQKVLWKLVENNVFEEGNTHDKIGLWWFGLICLGNTMRGWLDKDRVSILIYYYQ